MHYRTAADWDYGARKNGNRRYVTDGRVVDYTTGVTTYADHTARDSRNCSRISTRGWFRSRNANASVTTPAKGARSGRSPQLWVGPLDRQP